MSLTLKSRIYQFDFKYQGKRYRGSTGKADKVSARRFEKDIREEVRLINGSDDYYLNTALKRILLSQKESVTLNDAWSLFREESPALMKTDPSKSKWKQKESIFRDFKAFLESNYTNILTLHDIDKQMARKYINHLKAKGRFSKKVTYKNNKTVCTYSAKLKDLASSTINEYITQLKQFFNIMNDICGLIENPFNKIPNLNTNTTTRDVFTMDELSTINDFLLSGKFENSKNNTEDMDIVKGLFVIGLNTGLRRADICCLKWEHVNLSDKTISLIAQKSKTSVFIPMTAPLYNYLNHRASIGHNYDVYVNEELSAMYKRNPDGISYRFKKLLLASNIEKVSQSVNERTRAVSILGIHSLRHTFCFLHGLQDTPISTIQSMVGHLTPKMTEYYMNHKNKDLKEKAINSLSSLTCFKFESKSEKNDRSIKDTILKEALSLSDIKLRSKLVALLS